MAVIFADKPCFDPLTLAEECQRLGVPLGEWYGRANRFINHRDEPGEGDLLLSRKQLDDIKQDESHELIFADKVSGTKVTLKRIHIVAAVCATPGKPKDENSLYHVRVADIRRIWRLYPFDSGINCPITPGDTKYSDDTSNGGAAWTWAKAWERLWAALPTGNAEGAPKGERPSLPVAPNGNPYDLRYWGMSAWDAIDDFLRRLGMALCYNPFDDKFTIEKFGVTQEGLDNAIDSLMGKRLHDAEPIHPGLGRYPKKVRVLFPKRPEAFWGRDPWFAVESTSPNPIPEGTIDTATSILLDDMNAIMDAADFCSNKADLKIRANARAKEYFARLHKGNDYRQLVYSTAIDKINTGSLVSAVVWEDRGDSIKTEIVHQPLGLHDSNTWKANPTDERFNTLEHVWVYTSVSGVTPPTGYKPGQIDEWSMEDATWYKVRECWWKEHNGQTEVAGRHLGRFVGQLDGRPVYAGGCCPDGTGGDGPGSEPPDYGTTIRTSCCAEVPEYLKLDITATGDFAVANGLRVCYRYSAAATAWYGFPVWVVVGIGCVASGTCSVQYYGTVPPNLPPDGLPYANVLLLPGGTFNYQVLFIYSIGCKNGAWIEPISETSRFFEYHLNMMSPFCDLLDSGGLIRIHNTTPTCSPFSLVNDGADIAIVCGGGPTPSGTVATAITKSHSVACSS